ncbi:MAG: HesA/MoeB/ThiF family protein [Hyphomonas sp.]|uniref:HesA/MoeB/ThiF family protein n=1 Tax=Hyphomonas sp. TaxID=87 RepID=UPI0030035D9A
MTPGPIDIERHKRHILLKEIGGPGVQKLRASTVSMVGAGALGGPCALYLAAAGVGHIEIWDDDVVDRSNLQRQVQFGEGDVGQPKAETLVSRLQQAHPGTQAAWHRHRWSEGHPLAGRILIDASDNFPTRYALNATAHATGRRLVHGAAAGWNGQVSVFASGLQPDVPCYRCWVPETPPDAEACDEVGVVGAMTGMVGAAMALEVVKLVTGAGVPLVGRLLLMDGLSGTHRIVGLKPDRTCSTCGRTRAD